MPGPAERPWNPEDKQQIRDIHLKFQVLINAHYTRIEDVYPDLNAVLKQGPVIANRFFGLNAGTAEVFGFMFLNNLHILMAERTMDPVKMLIAKRDKEQMSENLTAFKSALQKDIPTTTDRIALDLYFEELDSVAREVVNAFVVGIIPPSERRIKELAARLKQAGQNLPRVVFTAIRDAKNYADRADKQEGKGNRRRVK